MTNPPPIDEYTLAAYLADTLPEDRRAEVSIYLAENAEARELLCMAQEALDVVDKPEVVGRPTFSLRADRPAKRLQPVFGGIKRHALAIAAVFLIMSGVGLYTMMPPSFDTVRSSVEGTSEFNLTISVQELAFEWSAIPETDYYKITVLDPLEIDVIGKHQTRATTLDSSDPFIFSLLPKLTPQYIYSVRLDAYDKENRLIQSSDMVEFSLPE